MAIDLGEEIGNRRKRLSITGADWVGQTLATLLARDEVKWMGITANRNPLDAWVYQQIIWENRPEIIIELGAYQGGTTLFLADMLDLVSRRNPSCQGEVIAVDINEECFQVGFYPRVNFIRGDTADENVFARVKGLCVGKKVMLIHDASHVKDDVLRDMEIWSSIVSPGQYLVVEDGIVDLIDGVWGHFDAGPMSAVSEFLERHPEFELDTGKEFFTLTHNPIGFLKRSGNVASVSDDNLQRLASHTADH